MKSWDRFLQGLRFRVGFCSATGGYKAWWLRSRDKTMENQVDITTGNWDDTENWG